MRNVYDNEFIRRYLYLLENKELILGLCINYDIEKDYLNTRIRDSKHLLKSFKKGSSEYELLSTMYNDFKKALREPKPYLMKKVDPSITNMYEEFLFGDE